MIAELFTNNALNLVIIFGSCAALILMSFWFRRGNRKRKGFLFHAVQFLIYPRRYRFYLYVPDCGYSDD